MVAVACHARAVSGPTTVDGVIARLREVDATLPRSDGVAVFNRMYLTVTQRIAEILREPGAHAVTFGDPEVMAALDVCFANLWLTAYDDAAAGRDVNRAWRPLFQRRDEGLWPIQYALAGMNAHIEHDLPIAVVDVCRRRGIEPDAIHDDFERVNVVLAQVEAPIRRSFLDAAQRAVDDRVGAVAHLVSSWNIDKARDLSWVTAETAWVLRRTRLLHDRFLDGVAHTVGMTSRVLLTPVAPPGP